MIALLHIFRDEEESSSAGLALLRDLDVPYEEYLSLLYKCDKSLLEV